MSITGNTQLLKCCMKQTVLTKLKSTKAALRFPNLGNPKKYEDSFWVGQFVLGFSGNKVANN